MSKESESKFVIVSDMLFVFAPIFILMILHFVKKDHVSIFYRADWSFASIILFGQAIVRFASGLSKGDKHYRWQIIAAIISFVIVFGLIPSAVLLALIYSTSEYSIWVYIVQIIIFIVGCFTYYNIGACGQMMLDNDETVEKNSGG